MLIFDKLCFYSKGKPMLELVILEIVQSNDKTIKLGPVAVE